MGKKFQQLVAEVEKDGPLEANVLAQRVPHQPVRTLNIKRVQLLVGLPGPDEISLILDAPPTFPAVEHAAYAKVSVLKGQGEAWLKSAGLEADEIIDVRTGKITR